MIDNPTTRKYPRTTGDAFRDHTYAASIERPANKLLDKILSVGLCLFIGAGLAAALVKWWTL